MPHDCPAPECDVKNVSDDMLACKRDWFRLPQGLRNRINAAWAHGDGEGSDQHLRFVREAYRWYRDNPR